MINYNITIKSYDSTQIIFSGYFIVVNNIITGFYDYSLETIDGYTNVLLPTNDVNSYNGASNMYPIDNDGVNFYSNSLQSFYKTTYNHFNIWGDSTGDPTSLYSYPLFLSTKQTGNVPTLIIINEMSSIGCFLANSKVLTDSQLVPIQLLKKGDLVQTLNHGLLPVKFVGKCSFFNKLTEERINAHLYKLNKNNFPELLEDLYVTGGHPLLVDEKDLDKETKKKLLDMDGTPIITEGKYRVFAMLHPKAELWNDEREHEIFDIVLENEDPKKNYGIWVNGILTESMDEEFFLKYSGMTEINN